MEIHGLRLLALAMLHELSFIQPVISLRNGHGRFLILDAVVYIQVMKVCSVELWIFIIIIVGVGYYFYTKTSNKYKTIRTINTSENLVLPANKIEDALSEAFKAPNSAVSTPLFKECSSISSEYSKEETLEEWIFRMRSIPIDKETQLIIEKHVSVLARKRLQLTYEDDYGVPQTEAWEQEEEYFIENVLRPYLPVDQKRALYDARLRLAIHDSIEAYLDRKNDNGLHECVDFDSIDHPLEYEEAVALALDECGWDAQTTKTSGDQGVDVIATKGGKRIVIQCKFYSSAVGNAAVQQVFAAKQHEQADYAAVVTNSTYTKSAKRLANTTGVLLLHHDDLFNLDILTGVDFQY